MTSGFDYEPRVGNNYPHVHAPSEAGDFARKSILYSFENTVAQSYTGDLRMYIKRFGQYLKSKASYWDPVKNKIVQFDIKYAAPNEVFSDNMGEVGKSPQNPIDSRIVIPIMSYHMTGMDYDNNRAQAPRNRMGVWINPNSSGRATTLMVAAAPKPMKFNFQVDLWMHNREQMMQINQAMHVDFMPYNYLYDLYDYDQNHPEEQNTKTEYRPYAKMTLNSTSDTSNYVPGTDRRVVRATWDITVEGWIATAAQECLPIGALVTADTVESMYESK